MEKPTAGGKDRTGGARESAHQVSVERHRRRDRQTRRHGQPPDAGDERPGQRHHHRPAKVPDILPGAVDRLYAMVYPQLRRMARRQLGGGGGATLNPTALVHEAYLKLAGAAHGDLSDRRHFLAVAARAMRQVIVDHARARQAGKRGAGAWPATLEEGLVGLRRGDRAAALLDLDAALDRLAERDERLVKVVELRFFGGLSVEEAAEALEVSTPTVKRDTRVARAFLKSELGSPARS